MFVLGIETVGRRAGVALAGARESASRELGERGRHAEALLPAVLDLFTELGLGWDAVGLLAVDEGPGSFTGLRVGVSFSLGVRDARGIPAVGLGSLDILARACYDATRPDTGTYVIPFVDVRRGEGVLGRFRVGPEGPVRESPDALVTLADPGIPPPSGAIVAGEGGGELWPGLDLLRWEGSGPERALAACRLGADRIAAGEVAPPVPRYARPADARPRRKSVP